VGGTCSTHKRNEKCIQYFGWKAWWGEITLKIDGKITLAWILGKFLLLLLLLSLAPQPSLGLGHLSKSDWISWRLLNNFLFYRVGLLAPRPNPHPGGPGLCIYIPRGSVATHFIRLLRHAWVTVGLFLFPGHHTERILGK
jgi:hypothetical protein